MRTSASNRVPFTALAVLVAAFLVSVSLPARAAQAPPFLAGAARVDITPETPVALQGYLNPEHRISTGVHDRLYVRAVVFVSGTRRLVVVSADLASFMFGPHLRRVVADRAGLQPEELLLCATHTHSGPQLSLNADYPHPNNARYTARLVDHMVEAVSQASRGVAPARLAVGRATSNVGMSRRLAGPDGRIVMAPNPLGTSDPEVLAITVRRTGGEAVAVLFSYACHARSLRGANTLISGDVMGLAAQHAEERLGQHVVVAAFAGASGDVDPAVIADTFEPGPMPGSPTITQGSSLGDSVVAAVEAADASPASPFGVSLDEVPLPSRQGGTRRVFVLTARLGHVGLVATECETSTQIGLDIKRASPFPLTFVATVCHAWGGYLPTAAQHAEGGYEVERTGYAPEAGQVLVATVLARLNALR